jgi:hypothetical protein
MVDVGGGADEKCGGRQRKSDKGVKCRKLEENTIVVNSFK